MIINHIIVLLIVIILFNSLIYNTYYKCPKFPLNINYLRASRLPGTQYDIRIGINTMNLKLDRDIPCGMYQVSTSYGDGILIVGRSNRRIGYLNIQDMSILNDINALDMWNIIRIESNDNDFINTYNRGCC